MRRRRTMYLDDARHYYLYVFEPPMTMEEAWLTVDQISGTAVDTFVYGVACGGTVLSDEGRQSVRRGGRHGKRAAFERDV